MIRYYRQCDRCGRVAPSRALPSGWRKAKGRHGQTVDLCVFCDEQSVPDGRTLGRPALDERFREAVADGNPGLSGGGPDR